MSEQVSETEHDPDVVSMDINDMRIEEIEFVEDKLDMGLGGIGKMLKDPEARQAKPLRVIAAIGHRKKNPDLTFDQAYEQAGKLKLKFAETPVPPTVDNGSELSLLLSSITE